MPDVKERIAAFDRIHGESVSDGSARYYRDGSMRDIDPLGALVGAECYDTRNPEYEYTLAYNKMRFAQLKLERAISDFDELNLRLATTNGGETALTELKRLQGVVEQRKALATEAEAALAQTRKGQWQNTYKQTQAEEQQRFNEFQRERRLIRI